MTRSVVVHGHFYQPPREDPWFADVPVEPNAAPFHDWNGRITHECYRPLLAARILDARGDVARTINLYEWMSFNVGPTLIRWLEAHAHDVYQGMLAGDAASLKRLGHGNAIAHPYHHVILPLASRRDKVTEVRWGIDDFRARFGREPEGMWMPETAMDEETLVVLAEAGMKFTIVAPTQVKNPPADGGPLWCDAGGGRRIALFAYDGALATGVAFGELLRDGEALAARLLTPRAGAAEDDWLNAVATDGETFGHHHKFSEMALARALHSIDRRSQGKVENFASVLAARPPRTSGKSPAVAGHGSPVSDHAVLVSPSAWSCAHGVERWRSNCGCHTKDGTSQEWRTPLREALNWLAEQFDTRFPGDEALWRARPWSERLAMFTSCGWFFDDLAGHETVIILRYAAWAIEHLGDPAIEAGFIERLAKGKCNDPKDGTGADVYRRILDARQDA